MLTVNDSRINTFNALAKYLKSLGHFVYKASKREMAISVMVVNKDGRLDFDTEDLVLTGSTPQEMYNQYISWIKDKSQWVEKSRVAIIENHPIDIFDLEEEILKLGFKYVEIEHEDSNFVEVLCKFCYITDTGKFQYDGDIFIDDKGDKFETLQFLQQWVMENERFQPTLNRF